MSKYYDLPCYDSRKSFYGKAKVFKHDNKCFLKSYDTIVCTLEYKENGVYFTQKWGDYSVTTMRHINSFLKHFGFTQYCGKKWWDSLPIDTPIKL